MPTAKVAFDVFASRISAAPSTSEAKKAHWWETPRSFGLTSAIASAVASLAAVARSPTASLAALARSPIASLAAAARSPIASRAALARSPIRSAPLRKSSTMLGAYPAEDALAEIAGLAQYEYEGGGFWNPLFAPSEAFSVWSVRDPA